MTKKNSALYPECSAYLEGRLRVSKTHELHYEEAGNPKGQAVIFLHGGPGGGVNPSCRRFFDPKKYRIILFDQRGCGKSTPHACLEENTTWDLVSDIELLREHLRVKKWLVFGGSWGSTLSLAYAQTHPEVVSGLILRGIFTLRRKELLWFYQEGASTIFPDAWEGYLAPIPEAERGDLLLAYHKRLTSSDKEVQIEAARAWSQWEAATSRLLPDANLVEEFGQDQFALSFARIESHYFVNGGFFEKDDQLIQNVGLIRHIPTTIVQGRYDVVCPMQTAWELHRAWPEAEFVLCPNSGHASIEDEIAHALVRATDAFANSDET